MDVLNYVKNQGEMAAAIESLALIALIGFIDYATGNEIAFSVFYVLPIALTTWSVGYRFGIAASVASAAVWVAADLTTRNPYSHQLIPVWNSLIRFAFFVIITLLLSALKKALQRESDLARIDHLTGAANSRFFHDVAQREIDRCRRYKHPFTLAYVDLDNFKAVNDQLGHSAGDMVLRAVTRLLKSHLRETDLVARLGGDEFAVLFTETDQDAARIALGKVQGLLAAEMNANHWPVTFSIGALTCVTAPDSTDALVKMADKLMYAAKCDGKNRICYKQITGDDPQQNNRKQRERAIPG